MRLGAICDATHSTDIQFGASASSSEFARRRCAPEDDDTCAACDLRTSTICHRRYCCRVCQPEQYQRGYAFRKNGSLLLTLERFLSEVYRSRLYNSVEKSKFL